MGCRLSRLPPSRLQLRGALWVLIGTVLSVALLLAIIGWGAAEDRASQPAPGGGGRGCGWAHQSGRGAL